MKPYLILEDGPHEVVNISYFDGAINSVTYKNGDVLNLAYDKEYSVTPTVYSIENLEDSIVWKDNAITKKLETLLEDELETLNDWSHAGMQENDLELMLKAQVQYNMQSAKIDGIEAALELVQGGE